MSQGEAAAGGGHRATRNNPVPEPVAVRHTVEGPDGAPVLVLGNSLGTDLAMWDQVVPLLRDRFRVVRYDHRGQGGSPVPDGPYEVEALGADVLALLDRLGVERAAYAGVSIGGMTALWLAAHAPQRIAAVAAFCTSAHPGGPDAWEQRARTVLDAGSVGAVADAVVDRWLTPGFAAAHPSQREELLGMLRASPVRGYAELCRLLGRLDLRPDLPEIGVPVLIVGAAQDGSLPPADHAQPAAAAIPGARYELLDPAAHIPMLEDPGAVARLIREHLEDHDE